MKLLSCLALILLLPAYATHAAEAPRVAVSIKPLYGLAAEIMGTTGTPHLIVTGTTSPHGFQLKPSQRRMLAAADIVFYMDDHLETFLPHTLDALPGSIRRVALSHAPGVRLLPQRSGGVWEGHVHAHTHAEEEVNDPHLWLDPQNARAMVHVIAQELSALAPQHIATYRHNAAALDARLAALDARLREELAPVQDTPFVVFHDALQYFERRYGLHAVGAITLDPHAPPSPLRLSTLRHTLRTRGARCVFQEPQFNPALVQAVMEGSSAKHGTLDPEGITLPEVPDLYFRLMEQLATGLKTCLTP